MRYQEAAIVGKLLGNITPDSCINLGSGDPIHQRLKKPWIDKLIFGPLQSRGVRIIHTDLVVRDGVDLKIDLSSEKDLHKLKKIGSSRVFLLCNVLEHVPAEFRVLMINSIVSIMNRFDHLIITVPFCYPYHADPIDTGYRPTAAELSSAIGLKVTFAQTIPAGNFREELLEMTPAKRLRKLLKPLYPFQKLSKYRENLSRLKFLFRNYEVTIVSAQRT